MKLEKRACEYCAKEATDWYMHVGWIQIGSTTVTVANGRKVDKSAKTSGFHANHNDHLDFCNSTCFTKWIARLQKTALERSK